MMRVRNSGSPSAVTQLNATIRRVTIGLRFLEGSAYSIRQVCKQAAKCVTFGQQKLREVSHTG
jgi:hypothetical protein